MIGQENIKKFLDNCVKHNTLSKFIIIRGEHGSGKKELVKYISKITTFPVAYFSTSVDSVRELITICYQQTKPIIYCIADCEKLSNNAQNALLKICEEPPRNAYIILTLNDDSLLSTLYSRAQLLIMEPYSYADMKLFGTKNLHIQNLEEKLKIAATPGDLIEFETSDFDAISKYCDNVVSLINSANIGSALKIGKKVKTKESDDTTLFNLSVFIKVLLYKYAEKCKQSNGNSKQFAHYYSCWNCVYDAKKQLSHTYNKQYVVDEMILRLREVQ